MKSKDVLHTLSDSDIETQRNVSRRSALSTIGIGVGAAAAALVAGTTPAAASDPRGRGRCGLVYRDRDPYNRRVVRTRRCSDRD